MNPFNQLMNFPISLSLSVLALAAPAFAQEYLISTLVGGAPPPTPAAGITMPIGEVTGLVPDPFGALYFIGRNSVFKLELDGTVSLVAGTGDRPGTQGYEGAATLAHLSYPATLALDASGNLYIADQSVVLKVSTEGIISRFAGTGVPGNSGDGGLAVNASLGALLSLAADNSGNVYISDTYNYGVRMVSASGIITTFAGGSNPRLTGNGDGGTAVNASMAPQALALDSAGNLFIADNWHFSIRKVTADGVIHTVAGSGIQGTGGDGGPATQAQFTLIWGLTVDGQGNIFISDILGPGRILEVSASTGTISTLAGGFHDSLGDGGPVGAASLDVGQIAADAEGDLFLADDGNRRIRKVTPDGVIHTVTGNGMAYFSGDGGPAASAQISPQDVAVDSAGNLYIVSNDRIRGVSNGIINTIAGAGSGPSGDGGPAINATFQYASHVAVDKAGNYYVADGVYFNGDPVMVRKISPSGIITTVAGSADAPGNSGDGGPAIKAGFCGIGGLAVDDAGNLYISDADVGDCASQIYGVIRKVAPDGTISTVAPVGGGPIAVDAQGNLYHGSGTEVQKISPAGTVSIFAGNSGSLQDGSGDGGPATAASIRLVTALAVDGIGNVFLADGRYDANTIRKISPGGIITTIAGVSGPGGYSGDDGPATKARLNMPMGLAVDAAGNVYVADTGNGVVRILRPIPGAAPLD